MTFGTGLDDTTLSVTGATRQFKTTAEKICWSAVLSAPVGATSVGAVVSLIGPGTAQTVVASDPKVPVTDPAAGLIAKCEDLRFLLGQQAGTYSIRYVHGGTVLAEGTFKLVK